MPASTVTSRWLVTPYGVATCTSTYGRPFSSRIADSRPGSPPHHFAAEHFLLSDVIDQDAASDRAVCFTLKCRPADNVVGSVSRMPAPPYHPNSPGQICDTGPNIWKPPSVFS